MSDTPPDVVAGFTALLMEPGGCVDAQQGRQYDVAPDGRFLINTELESAAAPITLADELESGREEVARAEEPSTEQARERH